MGFEDFFRSGLKYLRMRCILMNSRDIAQPGLARLTGGQKVRSSNLRIPTIFLPKFWQKKHEARQGFASYRVSGAS